MSYGESLYDLPLDFGGPMDRILQNRRHIRRLGMATIACGLRGRVLLLTGNGWYFDARSTRR
jgi:hypothetical protein